MSDGRDWFEVVASGPCPDCGVGVAAPERAELGRALTVEADRWASLLLAEDPDHLRRRPAPGVWSALEYGCHARDVVVVFTGRVERALAEVRPVFGWWDHEAAADSPRYRDAEPTVVAGELVDAVGALSRRLATLAPPDWEREGTRRSAECFTVEGQIRFVLHELHHHRLDALASVR